MPDADTATILNYQRLSTEDGPGIRTTVFFKGCPLHCSWCHNPESIAAESQVQWITNRCIGCLLCLEACPNQALSHLPSGDILVDREDCQGCGVCADICPSTALEMLGERITIDALVAELLKDRAYYEASAGGVTASGGEPTLQAPFVAKLFAQLQDLGIHTALDTCGACSPKALERILPVTDLLLYDLKLINEDQHRRATGQGNRKILENLVSSADLISARGLPTRLWIRTPLIPGISDCEDNLKTLGDFLQHNLAGKIDRWELCAFNNLCRDKYQRLGMSWAFEDTPLMSQTMLDRCEAAAKASAFDPDAILVTGPARVE
jgi:pyruvate formate lyase activating enzyme